MRSAHNRTQVIRGEKPGQDRYLRDTMSISTSANFKKSQLRNAVASDRKWTGPTPSVVGSGGPFIDRLQNQKCTISSFNQADNNAASLDMRRNIQNAMMSTTA